MIRQSQNGRYNLFCNKTIEAQRQTKNEWILKLISIGIVVMIVVGLRLSIRVPERLWLFIILVVADFTGSIVVINVVVVDRWLLAVIITTLALVVIAVYVVVESSEERSNWWLHHLTEHVDHHDLREHVSPRHEGIVQLWTSGVTENVKLRRELSKWCNYLTWSLLRSHFSPSSSEASPGGSRTSPRCWDKHKMASNRLYRPEAE